MVWKCFSLTMDISKTPVKLLNHDTRGNGVFLLSFFDSWEVSGAAKHSEVKSSLRS